MAFPNVPNVPGVPALPRLPGVVGAVVNLLVADALSLLGIQSAQWGLFKDGVPVVVAESVVSFEWKGGGTVATFPIEPAASGGTPGTFESYDKVMQPFNVRLRFACGGTVEDRQALEDSVEAAINSLDLMDAVTPEKTYQNVNPTSADYRRTAVSGVGLLVVDVLCEQIRSTASSTFTGAQGGTGNSTPGFDTNNSTTQISVRPAASIVNPQSPSASPQVNNGTVQPVANTTSQFDFPL